MTRASRSRSLRSTKAALIARVALSLGIFRNRVKISTPRRRLHAATRAVVQETRRGNTGMAVASSERRHYRVFIRSAWLQAREKRKNAVTKSAIGVVFFATLLCSASSLPHAQAPSKAIPPLALPSLSGRDSFDRYCAACHGAGGRGDGPAAATLKTPPADLTTLARRNGGTFPRQQVATYVEGTGRPLPAHGSSDMPVWGTTFRWLESSDARVKVRIDNLVAYIESLQLPAEQLLQSPASAQMTGAQLFRTYCASCHGENARGTGPMSGQLRRAAPDLTTFTARNGGMFPRERVRQMIEGRGPAVHGDRAMPVWGDVFRRQPGAANDTVAARIEALVAFLQSIQERPAE
jgi:mono/diheme cytochrome c family protein